MKRFMHHRLTSLGIGVLVAGLAAGCAAANGSEEPTAGDGEALVSQTIVRRGQDGKQTVTVKEVTVAEQRAEAEARRQRAPSAGAGAGAERVGEAQQADITADSCSNLDALWLYDGADGSGNQLCLIGNWGDNTSLNNFCHDQGWVYLTKLHKWVWGCTHSWSARVKSYWPGVLPGYIQTSSPFCSELFYDDGYEGLTNAGPCAQTADEVWFGVVF